MGILRTIRWYIYFFGYMLLHRRELDEGMQALAAGDNERVDALTARHVDHWCRRLLELAGVSVRVEGRDLVFTTVGCGHGVGLSQYGARYLALDGKAYDQILSHYYPGTQLRLEG